MSTPGEILIFLVLTPLLCAALSLMAGPGRERFAGLCLRTGALVNLMIACCSCAGALSIGKLSAVLGGSHAGLILSLDAFGAVVLVTVAVVVLAVSIYAAGWEGAWNSGRRRFYALIGMLLAGLNGVIVSGDLFSMFIFAELAVMPGYALTAFERTDDGLEASFKYAVLGSLASLFIMCGAALLYLSTGTLSFAAFPQAWNNAPAAAILPVMIFLVTGFALKATLVPLHVWVADAYGSAPAPVSALFAGATSKAVGVYALVRIAYDIFGADPRLMAALSGAGAVSILVAVSLALVQWDIKRLLAYHSVSQIGYIVLGFGLGTPLGVLGGIFHLINHSVFKPLLFMVAGSLERAAGSRDLKTIAGAGALMPVTRAASLVASLAISGVPPLNGFWSKLIIIVACLQAGAYWWAAAAALGSLLTLGSFLKIQRYAFAPRAGAAAGTVLESPLSMTGPMIALSCACVFLGLLLLPGVYSSFLGPAVDALMSRGMP